MQLVVVPTAVELLNRWGLQLPEHTLSIQFQTVPPGRRASLCSLGQPVKSQIIPGRKERKTTSK